MAVFIDYKIKTKISNYKAKAILIFNGRKFRFATSNFNIKSAYVASLAF